MKLGGLVLLTCLGLQPVPQAAAAADRPEPPYVAMDDGPTFGATIEVTPENLAYKGLAIRLDRGPGGVSRGRVFALFDTDLMRFAAFWTGSGFIDWRGVAFDGAHNAHPGIVGTTLAANPAAPGWANPQADTLDFNDPRLRGRDGQPYGPLPHAWARWKGLFLHGQDVVLAYSVGGVDVLEKPGLLEDAGQRVMTRQLEVGPHKAPLCLQVCGAARASAARRALEGLRPVAEAGSAADELAVLMAAGDRDEPVVAAAVVGAPAGSRWITEPRGQVRLLLPPSSSTSRFTIHLWRGRQDELTGLAQLVRKAAPPGSLEPLTHGGPPRWARRLETQARPGAGAGPFAIDELALPTDNPWHSWMRLGAFDFFADARRAAVCTWQGDVWVVDGLGPGLGKLTWQRIATGLYQPLGLKVVHEQIYVLGRDQITRLHDLNGDGETDFYENFNNDATVTEHFHEFAMDLQTDATGNFYYTKAGRHALDALVPQHGTLLRVSRDGARTEILARGFRGPNGLLVNPDGTFVVTDQEGHWTPMNRINWVRPGSFHGYLMGYLEQPRAEDDYEPPLCWIHREYDRSPSEPVRVTSPHWGALNGSLLCLSYGTGRIWNVLTEEVDGQKQGGIARLPMPELPTGIQRGRFHPDDGQLYVCGLVGWSSNQPRDGGFYRVRATGAPLRMPVALSATRYGLILTFSEPLEPASATDVDRYGVKAWNYRRTANYSSDDYRLSDGTPGRDTWNVTGVKLSDDHRSVLLQVPQVAPCMQMEITYDLRAADGAPVAGRVLNTIHHLRDPQSVTSPRFEGGLSAPPALPAEALAQADLKPGLALTLRQGEGPGARTDVRVTRLLALQTPAGQAPSSFLEPGPFTALFEGYILAPASGRYRFHVSGSGRMTLAVNGRQVLEAQTARGIADGWDSRPVALRAGPNAVRAELFSPREADGTTLRVEWSSDTAQVPRETIPPDALRFRPPIAGLAVYDRLRAGRTLFAELNCARCHALPEGLDPHRLPMPELGRDNPSLAGAGQRLQAGWMFHWVLDPNALRAHATMPGLFPGTPSPGDRKAVADLVAYVLSLNDPADHDTQPSPPLERNADLIDQGVGLYESLGCVACHTLTPPNPAEAFGRVSLHFVNAKFAPGALPAFLRAPQRHHAWSRMPDLSLTRAEAQALAAFLAGRCKGTFGPVAELEHADPARGQSLFRSLRCDRCHATGEAGPVAAADPGIPSLFGRGPGAGGCLAIAEPGAGPARAPRFSLTAADRRALAEFLAGQNGLRSLQREAPAEAAERMVARSQCAACHPRDGVPARLPQVLLDESETGRLPERLPALTWVGESLRPSWLEKRLAGTLEQAPRPWLKARMPRYPAQARWLTEGLAAQHGLAAVDPPEPPVDLALAEVGRQLALTKDTGFHCIQCHAAGSQPAVAAFENPGINLALVPRRLRYPHYLRWMLDPQRIDPFSGMLRLSPDRKTTPLKSTLNGDAERQFEALWHYLRTLPTESPTR